MSIQTARAGLISWLLENVCIRHGDPHGNPRHDRSRPKFVKRHEFQLFWFPWRIASHLGDDVRDYLIYVAKSHLNLRCAVL
jgi:hypothetical protein